MREWCVIEGGKNMENIEEIIEATVNKTIQVFKLNNLLRDTDRTSEEKCEEVLKRYVTLKSTQSVKAKLLVNEVDRALISIENDPYYEIIPLYYFQGKTMGEIAERLHVSETSISRNKPRLINELKVLIFTDDFIREII